MNLAERSCSYSHTHIYTFTILPSVHPDLQSTEADGETNGVSWLHYDNQSDKKPFPSKIPDTRYLFSVDQLLQHYTVCTGDTLL